MTARQATAWQTASTRKGWGFSFDSRSSKIAFPRRIS